jgi:hypothetical protein
MVKSLKKRTSIWVEGDNAYFVRITGSNNIYNSASEANTGRRQMHLNMYFN